MALAINRKNELHSKHLAYESEKNTDSYLIPCTKLRWQMNIKIEIKKRKERKISELTVWSQKWGRPFYLHVQMSKLYKEKDQDCNLKVNNNLCAIHVKE